MDEERLKSQQLSTESEQLQKELSTQETFNAAKITSLSRYDKFVSFSLKCKGFFIYVDFEVQHFLRTSIDRFAFDREVQKVAFLAGFFNQSQQTHAMKRANH